jgi:hypothetical protein
MLRSTVLSTATTGRNARTNGEFEGFQTQAAMNISKYYPDIFLEGLRKTKKLSSEGSLYTSRHCNHVPADKIQRITATSGWSAVEHTNIWHVHIFLWELLILYLWHRYNLFNKNFTSTYKLNETVFPSYMHSPLHFHHSLRTSYATNFNTKEREVTKLSHFLLRTFKRGHYLLCILVTPT